MSQVQFVESDSTVSFTEESAKDGIIGHIYANSWGLMLFGHYPYLAGGISDEGQPKWVYFKDVARVETVVDLLCAEAKRRGATHLIDLESDWISEWAQFTLIFWLVETEASATAIRISGDAPLGAIPLDEFVD